MVVPLWIDRAARPGLELCHTANSVTLHTVPVNIKLVAYMLSSLTCGVKVTAVETRTIGSGSFLTDIFQSGVISPCRTLEVVQLGLEHWLLNLQCSKSVCLGGSVTSLLVKLFICKN